MQPERPKCTQKLCAWCCCASCLFLLTLIFGSIAVHLLDNSRAYYHGPCDEFVTNQNDSTHVDMYCNTYRQAFHWTQTIAAGTATPGGQTEAVCPSLTMDQWLRNAQGEIVARSDQKIFSTLYKTYIRDCTGRTLYIVEMAWPWISQTMSITVNGLPVTVSLALYDPQKRVLGYVQGVAFFSTTWTVVSAADAAVAAMTNVTQELLPQNHGEANWHFSISNLSHPVGDLRWLLLITSQWTAQRMYDDAPLTVETTYSANGQSQTRTVKTEEQDGCANLFWGGAWSALAFFIVSMLMCCALVWVFWDWMVGTLQYYGSRYTSPATEMEDDSSGRVVVHSLHSL